MLQKTLLRYIDRKSGKESVEKVYGYFFIKLLYGKNWISRAFSFFLLPLFSCFPIVSKWYGFLQKTRFSKKKIKPFIKKFHIDVSEFLEPVQSFQSFNDFFTRKLKPSTRPIAPGKNTLVLPSDARYLVYETLDKENDFFVKDHSLSLEALLRNRSLARKYLKGSMVIGRMAPVDCHRIHFPIDCIPEKPTPIDGMLFSVNPLAWWKSRSFIQNKRVITQLKTKEGGSFVFIEVGATYVGTIHQTFTQGKAYQKGDEKGFFSFGGSCIILLFKEGQVSFDKDLLEASHKHIETLGLMGQSLGKLR